MPSRAPLWQALRPLEWALLFFAGAMVLAVGPRWLLETWESAGVRAFNVLFTLSFVGTLFLARDYAKLPWPPALTPVARLHWLALPVALLPLGAGLFFAAEGSVIREQLLELRRETILPVLTTVISRIAGLGMPSLMLWLAIGADVKRRGRIDLLAFARAATPRAAGALRDWLPIAIALSGYGWMESVIRVEGGVGRDAWMQAADRFLFLGHDPQDLLAGILWQPMTEWLAFAYSFYALMFPLSLGAALLYGGRAGLREASFAVGGAVLVSYVSYLLVPVKGPMLYRTFDVPLDLYLIAPIKEAMMDATRITWDCFPSMHTCCSVLLAWIAWRHARRLFWVMAPMAASIPLACVWLRYHYVVDVLAGLAFAAVTIGVTTRLRPWLLGELAETRGNS